MALVASFRSGCSSGVAARPRGDLARRRRGLRCMARREFGPEIDRFGDLPHPADKLLLGVINLPTAGAIKLGEVVAPLFDEIAPFVRNRLKPAMGWTVEHSGAVWAEELG